MKDFKVASSNIFQLKTTFCFIGTNTELDRWIKERQEQNKEQQEQRTARIKQ